MSSTAEGISAEGVTAPAGFEAAGVAAGLKSTGKPDSGFVDNTVDSSMIFHFQNGAWKIWTEKVLGVDAPGAGS